MNNSYKYFFRFSKPSYSLIKLSLLLPIFYGKKMFMLQEELGMKDIIHGEYLNRIRYFASTEKRFTIFAKIKSKDAIQMDYFQFLDSLTPFTYSKTLEPEQMKEKLENIPHFQQIMKHIDINNDGFINIEEYYILCAILSSKSFII